jgi:PIN domain nuclease of toxin-antitoxin system
MKLLLDTHALLWFLNNSEFTPTARAAIESPDNAVYVSVANLWEIAIKCSLGKLTLSAEFDQVFPAQLELNNFQCIQITHADLHQLCRLPFHHRDPFDRLLIAQALSNGLTLVTRDPHFAAYGVPILW